MNTGTLEMMVELDGVSESGTPRTPDEDRRVAAV